MKSTQKKLISGFIKRHPDGFGFFIPDDKDHPDVYVPQNMMKSAMTNDRATIAVEKERDGRFRGEIIKITERSQKRVAGQFKKTTDKYGIIKDEGRGWGHDLKIPLENSKNAQDGDLVEARITRFPDEGNFEGEVIDVIGDAKSALNDVRRVVITQNIPEHFSKETLEESKKFGKNPDEKDFVGRKDLRKLPIITIDGATAKDFDDAVLTEMTDQGFHLYVAIADVSHYVLAGSAMDKEAYERGNSVYFPNFVIPMLPEALSNGLCSLNPHVPRLALVAEMTFDFTGEKTSAKFYEGVIESQARVTYGEAQELLDGEANKEAFNQSIYDKLKHVKENIFRCADLAKVLMAKRFKEGSLDLEVPETELVIDGSGEPVDVIKSERLFAHRLIEELMLAANVAVAQFLSSQEIASFYRIHEPPDSDKISLLERYMKNMGASSTSLSGGKLQKRMTRTLQEFQGKPEAQIIHILTLRSMSQAKYTPNNLGHFGLGFDFYTHFTSPIRRYPDLIVHRLIKNRILPNSRYRLMSEEDLATAGTWLSATEQKAAKAERQIQAIKKARFMQKSLGESFDGIISSVTKFGVFVLLRQFNIDGLIRLEDLGKEKFEFDEENLTLTSPRSGLMYKMGDDLKVTVSLVDIDQGQINFVLEKNAHLPPAKPIHRSKENRSRPKEHRGGSNRNDRSSSKKSRRPEKVSLKTKSSKPAFVPPSPKVKPAPVKDVATSPIAKSNTEYEIKPRYSSLADYLDQKKKGSHEEKPESKPAFRSAENRKNTEERRSPQNDSGGFRQARSSKSRRKNKSR
jgi:ribonuclease R